MSLDSLFPEGIEMYLKDGEAGGKKAVAWSFFFGSPFFFRHLRRPGTLLGALLLLVLCQSAQALPSFARQTGQSCVACHAGGQFPELTPYGRLFNSFWNSTSSFTLRLSFANSPSTSGESPKVGV